MADDRGRQWQELFHVLGELLSKHGRESPYGQGDYWLLDDDYGGRQQKICVFEIAFLTRGLIEQIQALLRTKFPRWSVMVQLELLPPHEDVPGYGMMVHATWLEEEWDVEALALRFGAAFDWQRDDSPQRNRRLDVKDVLSRYIDDLQYAFSSRTSVDQQLWQHDKPLHVACDRGRAVEARPLLDAGADVNAAGHRGNRPLHLAAQSGNPALVSLLLAYGADPNCINAADETPLSLASTLHRGKGAVVAILQPLASNDPEPNGLG